MNNNLIEIAKRFKEIEKEMVHSGYDGELLDNHTIDVLTEELIADIDNTHEDIKKALTNMFFFGQVLNNK